MSRFWVSQFFVWLVLWNVLQQSDGAPDVLPSARFENDVEEIITAAQQEQLEKLKYIPDALNGGPLPDKPSVFTKSEFAALNLPVVSNDYVINNGTFDLHEAMTWALMASTAYCRNLTNLENWNCSRCNHMQQIQGFVVEDVIYSEEWNAFAYVGTFPARNAKVIAFRGTDSHSFWNWVEDLRAFRSSYPINVPGADGAYIHTGFYKMWAESGLKLNVTISLAKLIRRHGWDGTLYVTGHSMGGAMATLCGLYMKLIFSLEDVRVYTYGSPRVGNQAFYEFYNKTVDGSWRFTHMQDLVPGLPWMWWGYHHVAHEIWQVEVLDEEANTTTTVYNVCDGSGEDPLCHRQACWFGLCTSVTDHMTYLNLPMYTADDGSC